MVPGAALGRRGFLCRGPNGGLFIKLLFRFLVGYEGGGDDGDGDGGGGRRWAFERGFLFCIFFSFFFLFQYVLPFVPFPSPFVSSPFLLYFRGGGGW